MRPDPAPDGGRIAEPPRALAVVQARMSSRRLPGKVLADVGGEPLLALILRRLATARRVGRVVVATSAEPSDDPVAALAAALGAGVHRGQLDDVLGRFLGAVGDHDGPVVRITADCPLVDPGVVDALLALFETTPGAAYGSNVEDRTYPDGLDVEVFTPDALRRASRLATDTADREHVTTLMRRHPERFPAVSLTGPRRLGHLRWTVDTPADLEFVRAVVQRLGERRHVATMLEVLDAIGTPPALRDPASPCG